MTVIYKKMTQTQMIVVGYLLLILLGSILLMLPVSSRDGNMTSFADALFTSTSASCVTGLVVQDTYLHWSFFGQLIILILIQIGGMGFMTIGVCVAILLRRKIGLKVRGILQESINSIQIGGIVKLTKKIIKGKHWSCIADDSVYSEIRNRKRNLVRDLSFYISLLQRRV